MLWFQFFRVFWLVVVAIINKRGSDKKYESMKCMKRILLKLLMWHRQRHQFLTVIYIKWNRQSCHRLFCHQNHWKANIKVYENPGLKVCQTIIGNKSFWDLDVLMRFCYNSCTADSYLMVRQKCSVVLLIADIFIHLFDKIPGIQIYAVYFFLLFYTSDWHTNL